MSKISKEMYFDGVRYISASQAAAEVSLTRDYLARLCKSQKIVARREGKTWYIDIASLESFLDAQKFAGEFRKKQLAEERLREYRESTLKRIAVNPEGMSLRERAPVLIQPKVRPTVEKIPVVKARSNDIHERLRRALERKSHVVANPVLTSVDVPAGLTHSTLQGLQLDVATHVPAYLITPAAEFLHKLAALVTAVIIVFGTYAVLNPSYAHFAYDSFRGLAAASKNAAYGAANAGSTAAAAAALADDPASLVSHAHLSLEHVRTWFSSQAQTLASLVPTVLPSDKVTVQVTPNVMPTATMDLAAADAAPLVRLTPVAVSQPAPVAQSAAAAASAIPTAPPAANIASAPSTAPAASATTIATAVSFSGSQVAYGDIVAYDATAGSYALSESGKTAQAYGVVVQNPALLFTEGQSGTVPIVRSGSALVNVTLENGPIQAGDNLTMSSIPGKAERANPGDPVVGVAIESFSGDNGVKLKTPDGSEVLSGTIAVNTDMQGTGGGAAASAPSSGQQCGTLLCRLVNGINVGVLQNLMRYLLAGLIAIASLLLAFRSFVSDANYGVISMGRNPRAKSSIQSMVFFNALLATTIASGGLFAAMMVLFVAV